MRRISRTLGCLVIALACSASLAACKDAVTGWGGNPQLNPAFVALEASSGVSGENPTGTVRIHFGGGTGPDWRGQVSCLSVRGNTAIIGFGEGYYFDVGQTYWVTGLVRIVDNGATGDTFEYVELQTGEPDPAPPPPRSGDPLPGPTDCSSFPPDRTVYAIGGFRVNDALPLRASND